MSARMLSEIEQTELREFEAFNRRQLRLRIDAQHLVASPDCLHAAQQVLHVLIVDEDRQATDSLAELVGSWGHAVRSAYDGGAALESALAEQPDVVLLGIELSHAHGCGTARQLREDDRLGACFLVALAGGSDEVCRQQCMEAGIDLLLIKPVDVFVLETLLLLECERLDEAKASD